jgi:hypothetical protein
MHQNPLFHKGFILTRTAHHLSFVSQENYFCGKYFFLIFFVNSVVRENQNKKPVDSLYFLNKKFCS